MLFSWLTKLATEQLKNGLLFTNISPRNLLTTYQKLNNKIKILTSIACCSILDGPSLFSITTRKQVIAVGIVKSYRNILYVHAHQDSNASTLPRRLVLITAIFLPPNINHLLQHLHCFQFNENSHSKKTTNFNCILFIPRWTHLFSITACKWVIAVGIVKSYKKPHSPPKKTQLCPLGYLQCLGAAPEARAFGAQKPACSLVGHTQCFTQTEERHHFAPILICFISFLSLLWCHFEYTLDRFLFHPLFVW